MHESKSTFKFTPASKCYFLQEMDFLRSSRVVFGQMAQFLSQASRDESKGSMGRKKRNNKSFMSEMQRLQEAGVYDILCHIDVDMVQDDFETSDIIQDCQDELKTLASIDNRNYMILHTYKVYLDAFQAKMHTLFDKQQ